MHQIKILLQDFEVSDTRCLWGTLPPNEKALGKYLFTRAGKRASSSKN